MPAPLEKRQEIRNARNGARTSRHKQLCAFRILKLCLSVRVSGLVSDEDYTQSWSSSLSPAFSPVYSPPAPDGSRTAAAAAVGATSVEMDFSSEEVEGCGDDEVSISFIWRVTGRHYGLLRRLLGT